VRREAWRDSWRVTIGITVACAALWVSACSVLVGERLPVDDEAFLDAVEQRTFNWFWEMTPADNGLTPDRTPGRVKSSIAAVGFALSAYPVGVERGWITRSQARDRTLATLRFLWEAPQGPQPSGTAGYRGFFYHFLDLETGMRHRNSELSSIDTALLLGGVLLAQAYFDRPQADEVEIRRLADAIYARVDWTWLQQRAPLISMAWRPETGEFSAYDWRGYNEAMLLYVLALGAPVHPVQPLAWGDWARGYEGRWGSFQGQEYAGFNQKYLSFAPLFGNQYSHVWIDFRWIQDDFMRRRGINYFENSRRASYAQREYAIVNPMDWRGYGADVWGLTASDGPGRITTRIDGVERQFRAYWARGVAPDKTNDDGTIAPTAVGGSVPFAPEIAIPALRAMATRYGEHLFTPYGFFDAFNPTLRDERLLDGAELVRGEVVSGLGWFSNSYIGIDQGPILLMIENYRSEMIWDLMKKSEPLVRGLCRGGFRGGWLEEHCQ